LTSTLAPTQVPVPDPTAQLNFTILQQELKEEHRPTTPTQTVLVEELALIIWKLQYLPRVEHRLLNTPLDRPETPQPDPAHLTPHPRLDHAGDPTAAILALHLSQDTPTPLTRLHSLHHRLQSRLNSILNQLRQSRKDQQQHDGNDAQSLRAQRARERANHQVMNEEIEKVKRNIEQRATEARLQRQPEQTAAARNEPTVTAPSPDPLSPFTIQHSEFPPPTAPARIEPTFPSTNPKSPTAPAQIKPTFPQNTPPGHPFTLESLPPNPVT